MNTPGEDVPSYSYLLAVVVGPAAAVLPLALIQFIEGLSGAVHHDLRVEELVSLAVCYLFAGGAFGLLWPEKGWRWGVWLCALPACLVSFFAPSLRVFLFFAALTLVPACAGAYVVARAHLKYTRVI
jgi:hypothetical protein